MVNDWCAFPDAGFLNLDSQLTHTCCDDDLCVLVVLETRAAVVAYAGDLSSVARHHVNDRRAVPRLTDQPVTKVIGVERAEPMLWRPTLERGGYEAEKHPVLVLRPDVVRLDRHLNVAGAEGGYRLFVLWVEGEEAASFGVKPELDGHS